MTIKEIQQKNVDMLIPTKWNIYEWTEKHPDTTIAHALKRIEKIFDFSDSIQLGVSGGKDSTVSANLACLELNLRRLRVANNIMRDGATGIDPLDKKWINKRIHSCSTNAEVVFSDTNNYIRRFLAKYGPEKFYDLGGNNIYKWDEILSFGLENKFTVQEIYENVMNGANITIHRKDNHETIKLSKENCCQVGGFDLLEHNEICFPMAWQSGVSFDSGILISWDSEKKSQWVQEMPTREDLHGFDCVNFDNRNKANPVPLESLPEYAQNYHKNHDNVFYINGNELFNSNYWAELLGIPLNNMKNQEVLAVANFGRGPILPDLKKACHEKDEQDDYSYMFSHTSWLLDNRTQEDVENCKKRLEELYDISENVWIFTPVKNEEDVPEEHRNNVISTALISLRAEESLDRRVILSQGEYSTGQYSNNKGTNICSPVFDFSTADIWRLLSATDWDVNDVYEKLYEIGVGISDQRVGSLLNYAAVRQIGTVKALEPDLYARINARFQNVEFMSQFSRAGYYKIGKPRNTNWDGHNHIKAGREPEEIKALSDRYENLLKKLEIPYIREGNEFKSNDPKYKGKAWFPLKNYMKEHPELFEEKAV